MFYIGSVARVWIWPTVDEEDIGGEASPGVYIVVWGEHYADLSGCCREEFETRERVGARDSCDKPHEAVRVLP